MAYIRGKTIKGKKYYYLVRGEKSKNGKIKQKVLAYIGDRQELGKLYNNMGKKLKELDKSLG